MSTATQTHEVPDGVLLLLQHAIGADLLDDVEAMAGALIETGWVRLTGSGSWSYAADTSWTVQSADHDPSLSIFAQGEDEHDHEHLLHLADALRASIDSGQVGAVQPGEADPDWSTWTGGHVVLMLNVTPQRQLGKHRLPALLQLAIERAGAPFARPALDLQRARRLARGGSPIARWYLAGEDRLPEDVVALLAVDEDAAVVAALDANEGQRRVARGEL